MVNADVQISRDSDTFSIGREILSGVLGGFPRRFLKWSYQLAILFALDPHLMRVDGLELSPESYLTM